MPAPDELRNAIDASQAPAGLLLAPGTIIDDRYQITSFLGEGGMCQVFKADHLALQRTAAVKLLKPKLLTAPTSVARFMQEAKALSELKNPNIVEIFSIGTYGQTPYIALEYLDGVSLADLLDNQTDRKLPLSRALPIFIQICQALEFAHSKGVIHRDLKPSNVIVLPQDRIKLVDFGIAKILDTADASGQRLTQSGSVIGTPQYMSPEQCLAERVDARSDIYSLGCLMHEVLTGEPPFTADSSFALLNKHVNTTVRIGLPGNDPIVRIIAKTLDKDPSKRPQSAGELKDLLMGMPSRRFIDRKYLIAVPIALAIALSGIIMTSKYLGTGREDDEQKPVQAKHSPPGPPDYLYKDSIVTAGKDIEGEHWDDAQTHLTQAYELASQDKRTEEERLCQVNALQAKLIWRTDGKRFFQAIDLDRQVVKCPINSEIVYQSKMIAYPDLCGMLAQSNDHSQIMSLGKACLKLANEHGIARDRCSANWLMGRILEEDKNFREGIIYLKQAEDEAIGSQRYFICVSLARCYSGLINVDGPAHAADNESAAVKWYQTAKDMVEQKDSRQAQAELAKLEADWANFKRDSAAHHTEQPQP